MYLSSVQSWIGVVASLSALIVGLVTALWVYTTFIVERGLLPPVDFWIDCTALGAQFGQRSLEITVHLKNVGSSTLIATDIRLDIRYLTTEDSLEVSASEEQPMLFGRLMFKRSLRTELLNKARLRAVPSPPNLKANAEQRRDASGPGRGFYVMAYDTFIQSHIDQTYTFVTAVPNTTSQILVWSSFRYGQSPKPLQRATLWVSRRLGLVQFTLGHVTAPHTTERVFDLTDGSSLETRDVDTPAALVKGTHNALVTEGD